MVSSTWTINRGKANGTYPMENGSKAHLKMIWSMDRESSIDKMEVALRVYGEGIN